VLPCSRSPSVELHKSRLFPWGMAVPVIVCVFVAAYHSVFCARDLAQRAVAFHRGGRARVEDHEAGARLAGERFSAPHHVYAADLGLFGRSRLFEPLSTARTGMGGEPCQMATLAFDS
jgi:hypothetical protein